MISRFASALHRLFVPSHKNAYHPHLMGERGLLALFALILGTEGFLVSNLIASLPGAVPLAAVGNANAAGALPPLIAAAGGFWTAYIVDPIARAAAVPAVGRGAFFVLLITAAGLMAVLAFTISARRRALVPVGYIAGGTMLALAAAFIAFDMQLVFPAAIALQTPVVQETASVALSAPSFNMASSTLEAASSTASTTLNTNATSSEASSTWQQPTPEI